MGAKFTRFQARMIGEAARRRGETVSEFLQKSACEAALSRVRGPVEGLRVFADACRMVGGGVPALIELDRLTFDLIVRELDLDPGSPEFCAEEIAVEVGGGETVLRRKE